MSNNFADTNNKSKFNQSQAIDTIISANEHLFATYPLFIRKRKKRKREIAYPLTPIMSYNSYDPDSTY